MRDDRRSSTIRRYAALAAALVAPAPLCVAAPWNRPPPDLRGVGNDECAGALNLGNANPATLAFDNSTATTGADGQSNSLCNFFGSTAIARDEWFKWSSPLTGTATLQACGSTAPANLDTKIAVYGAATCPPGPAIACNDDACGLTSSVTFPVASGTTYLFQIGLYNSAAPTLGSGTFTVTASLPGSGPANDDCSTATVITSLPFTGAGTTVGALPESVGACGTSYQPGNPAVWYRLAGSNQFLEVTTCDAATNFDTKLQVYRGSCSGLTCVTGNDDDPTCIAPGLSPPSYRSRLTFCSLAGSTYFIMVYGYQGSGAFTLLVTAIGACSAPPNDECAAATALAGPLPITFAASTTQATTGVDGQASALCNFFGTTAIDHDLWYTWHAAAAGDMILQGCMSGGGSHTDDTKVAVYDGVACPPAQPIACNEDYCNLTSRVAFTAVAGHDYLFQIGAYQGSPGGAGNFNLSSICQLTIPPAVIQENEPACGLTGNDTVNGGCNSFPPVFLPISCAQTVHGTAGATAGAADTDWYQVVTAAPVTTMVWTVSAEFSARIGLVEIGSGLPSGHCANITGLINPSVVISGDCQPVALNISVGPGTWWLFVAPTGLDAVPCGADYLAALTFAAGCPPPPGTDCFTRGPAGALGSGCASPIFVRTRPQGNGHFLCGGPDFLIDSAQCIGDWDGDGCILPSDVAAFVATWFYSAVNPPNLDGDMDCDSVATPADVAAFITHWFNGIAGPVAEGCV